MQGVIAPMYADKITGIVKHAKVTMASSAAAFVKSSTRIVSFRIKYPPLLSIQLSTIC